MAVGCAGAPAGGATGSAPSPPTPATPLRQSPAGRGGWQEIQGEPLLRVSRAMEQGVAGPGVPSRRRCSCTEGRHGSGGGGRILCGWPCPGPLRPNPVAGFQRLVGAAMSCARVVCAVAGGRGGIWGRPVGSGGAAFGERWGRWCGLRHDGGGGRRGWGKVVVPWIWPRKVEWWSMASQAGEGGRVGRPATKKVGG